MSKQIEIEFRSRFDKKKYDALAKFLKAKAKDLGQDDKDVYFFIFPGKLLKVVNNVSQKTAKLVMKLNKIGRGSSFEEIEMPIEPKNFNRAVKIFTLWGCQNIMRSFQKRHNYLYKGVELALKYSKHWGYHLELEIMINNPKQKQKAEKQIKKIAAELKISLMTDAELKKFTKQAERDYKKNNKK
ncbi:MAG: hypothetical protein PHT40_02020 [Patescibacteria group bacterium]|nr:hypothetical protein [Patescibacteria group bacterium]